MLVLAGLWWWPGRGRLPPPRASAPPADCGCGASWGVAAGMFSATQTAINGHLGQVVGSPDGLHGVLPGWGWQRWWCCAPFSGSSRGRPPWGGKFPWWTWTGGLLGAVYVLANIYLSGILGTGMTVIILLVGATAGARSLTTLAS